MPSRAREARDTRADHEDGRGPRNVLRLRSKFRIDVMPERSAGRVPEKVFPERRKVCTEVR